MILYHRRSPKTFSCSFVWFRGSLFQQANQQVDSTDTVIEAMRQAAVVGADVVYA